MKRRAVGGLVASGILIAGAGGLGGCPLLLLFSGPVPLGGTIGLTLVADGLVSPLKVVEAPDGSGRRFVVEQAGQIRVISADGTLIAAPFLNIVDRLVPLPAFVDERGLLGLAFHPDFAGNGRFYVYYSAPKQPDVPAEWDHETHVAEFRAVPPGANTVDAATEKIILRFGQPQANHNGGDLAFGPDELLYIATGDGGASHDVGVGHTAGIGNAQDKSNLLGKLLRIDVDGGDPYAIPSDNPFVGEPGARGEIYAYGFRNPYRFSFDTGDANRLFVGDVGQALFEEVDIVVRGGNYGWFIREGRRCLAPADESMPFDSCATVGPDGAPLVPPILDYSHPGGGEPVGLSVIGGFVYRGGTVPALIGRYLFGDYTRGFIIPDGSLFIATEQADGTWTFQEAAVDGAPGGRIGAFVLGFGQDLTGEIYVCTSNAFGATGTTGRVWKITAAE